MFPLGSNKVSVCLKRFMFGNTKHTCWSLKLFSSLNEWRVNFFFRLRGMRYFQSHTHSGTLSSRWAVSSPANFMFSVNTCAAEGLQRPTDTVYFRIFYLLPKSLVCTGLLSDFTLLGLCCSKVFSLGNYQTFFFHSFFFLFFLNPKLSGFNLLWMRSGCCSNRHSPTASERASRAASAPAAAYVTGHAL